MTEEEFKEIDSEEENNILVVDPDDYRQTQQLKQIHKAKEKYTELKTLDEPVQKPLYVKRIQSLVMELEPVMEQVDTEKDYLQGVKIDTIRTVEEGTEIHYSEDDENLCDTKEEAISLAKELGHIQEVTLWGVASVLDYGGYMGISEKRTHYRQPNKLTAEKRYFSRSQCDTVFRYCRAFISEAGLGLKIEEDTGPAQI